MTSVVSQDSDHSLTEGEKDASKEKAKPLSPQRPSSAQNSSEKDVRKSIFVSQIQDHDEMSGYLYKRRGGFGRHMPNAWQLRYFTLRDGIMYYFEDSGGVAKPRGKIDLKSENCTFFNGVTVENAPSLYTMQIVPGGWEEKWKLCAQSKEDMELWVAAIMRHITDERKRQPAPLNLKEYGSSDDEDDKDADQDESAFISSVRPQSVPPPPASMQQINVINAAVSSNHKAKNKRKLKLQTDTSGESDEMEFVMVLVIVNCCVFFAYTSSQFCGIIYVAIANLVVARTLQLRSARLQQEIVVQQSLVKAAAAAGDAGKSSPSVEATASLTADIGFAAPSAESRPAPGMTGTN
jgi:hypothetical protein